jgi:hypothetical protein
VRRQLDENTIVFEMSEAGVSIRQLYARSSYVMSFSEIFEHSIGQKLLPLKLPERILTEAAKEAK